MVSEVLLTPKKYKVRNWCCIVAFSAKEGPYHPKNGVGSNRVSTHPSGRGHCSVNIDLTADKSEVYWVAKETISSPRSTDEIVGNIEPREQLMDSGECEVGGNGPADQELGDSGGFELD